MPGNFASRTQARHTGKTTVNIPPCGCGRLIQAPPTQTAA
jgi:hypothetical protein